MAKPNKASKSSKSKSVSRTVTKAKSKSAAKPAAKRAVAHKSPKVKSAIAKPAKQAKQKIVKATAKVPKAHKGQKVQNVQKAAAKALVKPLKASKVAMAAEAAKLKKLTPKGAEKLSRVTKNEPLSEKDERLAKLKAIAEQMAKAKAGGAVAAPVVEAAAVPVAGKEARKKPTRGLTAKEKALVKEFERREMSPADAEARRNRLKNLIMLGKERNYLTYAEINDHLPDEMLEAEQIETIIGMINDMGILVYDEAPDAETLLMSDATPPVADEEAAAEAEAALSTWSPREGSVSSISASDRADRIAG